MEEPEITVHLSRGDLIRANLGMIYQPASLMARPPIIAVLTWDRLWEQEPTMTLVTVMALLTAAVVELVLVCLAVLFGVIRSRGGPEAGGTGRQYFKILEGGLMRENGADTVITRWHRVGRPNRIGRFLCIPIVHVGVYLLPLDQIEDSEAEFVNTIERYRSDTAGVAT